MSDQTSTSADAAVKEEVKSSSMPTLQLPTSQSGSASPNKYRKGHAPQPSVGIAASLFGSVGDEDPFASISAATNTGNDSFSANLDQVQEGEEDEENGADASAPADPVADIFGAMTLESAAPSTLQDRNNAVESNDNADAVTTTPGGLFAESSYQDNWLQSTPNDSTGPIFAESDQHDLLPWDNNATNDTGNYYNHDQPADANDAPAISDQNVAYATQSYTGQGYDPYGQPLGQHDYSNADHYGDYYASQEYDAQTNQYSTQSYGLDAEVAQQASYLPQDVYSASAQAAPGQTHNTQMYPPVQPEQKDFYASYDYSHLGTGAQAVVSDHDVQSQQQYYNSEASTYDYSQLNKDMYDYTPSYQGPTDVYTADNGSQSYGYTDGYGLPPSQEGYDAEQPDAYHPQENQQQLHLQSSSTNYDYSQYAEGQRSHGEQQQDLYYQEDAQTDAVEQEQFVSDHAGHGSHSGERDAGHYNHSYHDKESEQESVHKRAQHSERYAVEQYPAVNAVDTPQYDEGDRSDVQVGNFLSQQENIPDTTDQQQDQTFFADDTDANNSTDNSHRFTQSEYSDEYANYLPVAPPSLQVSEHSPPLSTTLTAEQDNIYSNQTFLNKSSTLMSPSISNSGRYAPVESVSKFSQQASDQSYDQTTPNQQSLYNTEAETGGYFGAAIMPGSPHTYAQNVQSLPAVSPYASQFPPSGTRSFSDAASLPSSVEGASDALQVMRNARIPLASFGIGGKLVTYFPSASARSANRSDMSTDDAYASYGYSSSSHSTTVTVHPMATHVTSSSYASLFDPLSFPGPAFDGLGSVTALSRATGTASANKAKKASMIKHLEERIQELSAGIGYLRRRPSSNNANRAPLDDAAAVESALELDSRRTEDKVHLLRLLKLLVECDGQTTIAAFEQGVRALIVPETSGKPAFDATSLASSEDVGGKVVCSYELKTSFLQRLQTMLLSGERREAVDFAVSQRMWAHAITISACVDKECSKSVMNQFIEQELGLAETNLSGDQDLQGLKVAYNVFSGQDPVSIFDLFRKKTQLNSASTLRPDAEKGGALLPSWKAATAMVSANKSPADAAALTAIADGLSTRGLVEAAHFCYLLSPQSSPMGGADTTGIRFTLLGLANPKTNPSFVSDLDGIMMTEVLEYAQGLVPVAKGQEAFAGIPHLQAYKLVHAHALAELGDVAKAQKYCEAIAFSLKSCKNSPYLHATLLSQLKQLSDRLVGAPQRGPGGNWVTRKIQRPTLDGVWGALEGRFTKFIAGEDGAAEAESPNRNNKGSAASSLGPFSHYSAITPDAASGGITRQQSFTDMRGTSPSAPGSRSGSAMDFRSASKQAASPKYRAASALAMRSIHDNSDWSASNQQQPAFLGHDGSSIGPGSSRNSFEAGRHGGGHGLQYSETSNVSSTYDGPGDTSYTSEQDQWHGNRGSYNVSQSEMLADDSKASGTYGSYGYGGYGGSQSGYSNSVAGDGAADEDESRRTAPSNVPFFGYQPHGAQKPQFVSNVDASALDGEGGFVSPFDAMSSQSHTPQPQTNDYAPSSWKQVNSKDAEDEEEEDDLGFGNASTKKNASAAPVKEQGTENAKEGKDAVSAASSEKDSSEATGEKRQELKSSASWFGRIWGRSSSTDVSGAAAQAQAKAKKAHLGNEVTFYYDQDLKRWVNKKAGDSGAATTPPPPPPRAQTASPSAQPDRSSGATSAPPIRRQTSAGSYNGYAPSEGGGAPPPPSLSTRAASAAYTVGRSTPPISEDQDEGGSGLSPNRGPPGMGTLSRARSNLADHSMPPASQPPSARSGTGTPATSTPPPPGAASKTGTVKKRPIKSRYVVVD